ncbi:MAG: hypothetical protein J3R72DRAFT_501669 [Linnemannia gamsii]|nr:MAG: hypothetical protein J3R72DRAFT_501669 [Linnemannia gamsii]
MPCQMPKFSQRQQLLSDIRLGIALATANNDGDTAENLVEALLYLETRSLLAEVHFGFSTGAVMDFTRRVIDALVDQEEWLHSPDEDHRHELSQVMADEGFPGFVGFVEVCDVDERIIAYHVGRPGSSADSSVFHRMVMHGGEEFVGEEPEDGDEPDVEEANNDEIAFREQLRMTLLHHHDPGEQVLIDNALLEKVRDDRKTLGLEVGLKPLTLALTQSNTTSSLSRPVSLFVLIRTCRVNTPTVKQWDISTLTVLASTVSARQPVKTSLNLLGSFSSRPQQHGSGHAGSSQETCWLLGICGFMHPDDIFCTDVARLGIVRDMLELAVVLPKKRRGTQRIIKYVHISRHADAQIFPVQAYSAYRTRTFAMDLPLPHAEDPENQTSQAPRLRIHTGSVSRRPGVVEQMGIEHLGRFGGVSVDFKPRLFRNTTHFSTVIIVFAPQASPSSSQFHHSQATTEQSLKQQSKLYLQPNSHPDQYKRATTESSLLSALHTIHQLYICGLLGPLQSSHPPRFLYHFTAPMADIMAQGHRSSPKTFEKHYRLSSATANNMPLSTLGFL